MAMMIMIVMKMLSIVMMMINQQPTIHDNKGQHFTFIECLKHYYRVLVDTELALHLIGGGVCIHISLIIRGDEVEGFEVS